MSEGAVTILIYTGAGLLAVVAIFLGALWFANAAKKGNLRFRWAQRRRVTEGTERDPQPRHESG